MEFFRKNKSVIILIAVPLIAILATMTIQRISSVEKPKSIEECWQMLETNIRSDEIQKMKDGTLNDMEKLYDTYGAHIQKVWLKKGDPGLLHYFREMGTDSPDIMAKVILDTFWLKINGRPADVETRILYHLNYSRKK